MRAEDRVAIHEVMEQQTISIAKAGITTVLSSRTSVLAAANPPSGRFDDLKTARYNIDLQATILSRFDLIFILKDIRMYGQDKDIASHIIKVHASANAATGKVELLKKITGIFSTGKLYAILVYQILRPHCCRRDALKLDSKMAVQTKIPLPPPSAQVVGNAFVEQYYHILHRTPESVYRFYEDSSVLSRPEPDGVMTSVTTKKL